MFWKPSFPWTTSLGVMTVVFVVLLVIFDLALVRWVKLGKQAWKRVDYLWLGFAALGLIAAVAQARIYAANNQLQPYQERAAMMYQTFHDLVSSYTKPQGAACDRYPGSPAGLESEKVCQWARALNAKLGSKGPPLWKSISPEDLGDRPELTLEDPRDIVEGIHRQLSYYNERAQELADLTKSTKQTDFEQQFAQAYPFWLALALALRITKVTGELKLG